MKVCLLLLLCLCHPGLNEEASPTPESLDVAASVGKEEEAEKKVHSCGAGPPFSLEEHRALGGTIEKLGLQLLERLPVGPQQPNVVLSPLSVALALAQLTLGARNETEKLLLRSLHAHNLPCYHHLLGGLVPHLTKATLAVAARMYLRPGFQVKLPFVQDSLARYRSRPLPLPPVEEVNLWVENVTNGHVANFLESIPHNVVLMLINAVYFKGEWKTRFDPQVTAKGTFYLDQQKSVSVDMMKSAHYPLRLLDATDLEAQVASLPFKGNTSFLVVIPRLDQGNVSSLLPRLNISDLYRRLPQERSMQVNLPKLKLQYRQELQEALTSMGLDALFSGPDLSGISDEPLTVSAIRHGSGVELSEDGVEASASTAVTSLRSVSLFAINSPFLFALVDDVSLTPLFMGVVTNPAPDNDPMLHDGPHGNATMSDQPVKEVSEERDSEYRLCNETAPVAGEGLQTCGAPAGEKPLVQHVNGLEGKAASNQTTQHQPQD